MSRGIRKFLVKLRMWWADIRGHHGKVWDYEPSDIIWVVIKVTKNI